MGYQAGDTVLFTNNIYLVVGYLVSQPSSDAAYHLLDLKTGESTVTDFGDEYLPFIEPITTKLQYLIFNGTPQFYDKSNGYVYILPPHFLAANDGLVSGESYQVHLANGIPFEIKRNG